VREDENGLRPFPLEALTSRESEILNLLADHLTNREIGELLILSLNTVKWYARQIYSKLGVANRRQAVLRAKELGLLRPAGKQHNLPPAITPFIGRQEEQEAIQKLIAGADTRLLTLTGLGGIGKTRLAIQVASDLAEEDHTFVMDGIYFVGLAAATDLDSMVSMIARALNLSLREGMKSTRQQLLDTLGPKHLLLVLDNCEHLEREAGLFSDIMRSAPGVKLIATSRKAIGLQAEWLYEVHGLQYPDDKNIKDPEAFPAVTLFIRSAQRVHPDFLPDRQELMCIAEICRQVEGLPLALELAAAWINTLDCAQISNEIGRNLDILETKLIDIPERQRSIEAVFEHSWQMMPEDDQQLFMRLSVFTGGFSIKAAQGVAGTSVHDLSAFLRRSMLRRSPMGRYEIHELIRQFALSNLAKSGMESDVRDKHLSYFTNQLGAYEIDLKGQDQINALREIGSDLDNIRIAWKRAVEQLDVAGINRMLEALYLYCIFRRGTVEGDKLLKAALEEFRSDSSVDTSRLCGRLIARYEMLNIDTIRFSHSDMLNTAKDNIEDALSIARRYSDKAEIAFCKFAIGRAAMYIGNRPEAITLFEESLADFEQLGDLFYQGYARFRIALSHELLGNTKQVLRHSELALDILRPSGNQYVTAWTLILLPGRVFEPDAIEETIEFYQEALAIWDELEDMQGRAWGTAKQALFTFFLGNFSVAKRLSMQAIAFSKNVRHQPTTWWVNSAHSLILAGSGEYDRALEFVEEAQRILGYTPNYPTFATLAKAYATCIDGDLRTAKEDIQEAIQGLWRHSYINTIINGIPVLAMILFRENRFEKAQEVFAMALHDPLRMKGWWGRDPLVNEIEKRLREALSDDAYAEASARGKHLELTSVVEDVLENRIWT
jgi:predicted ATPase/DNA-binding CsgD family transcriptional regulator